MFHFIALSLHHYIDKPSARLKFRPQYIEDSEVIGSGHSPSEAAGEEFKEELKEEVKRDECQGEGELSGGGAAEALERHRL
jgi:hypothetical protein